MKKNHIYIALTALVLCASAMLTGCTLETSGNGKLDGYWHMTAVDTIATGGTCDLSQQRLFWGIQAKLINLSNRDDLSYDFFMRFEHASTTLRVYEPYHNDRIGGDPAIEDAERLEPFGIEGLEQSFRIEELKGKRMTLASENLRLHFEKM